MIDVKLCSNCGENEPEPYEDVCSICDDMYNYYCEICDKSYYDDD